MSDEIDWITDRLPTAGDGDSHGRVFVSMNEVVNCVSYSHVRDGMPWMPMIMPQPYVPPKPEPDTSLAASCNRLEVWFNDFIGVAEYECGDVLTSDDAQRIIEAARKWNEANNGWQVTTLEDADQYSYDGVQWSPIETCPIYNTPPLMFRRRIEKHLDMRGDK